MKQRTKIMYTHSWPLDQQVLTRLYRCVMIEQPDILVIDKAILSQDRTTDAGMSLMDEIRGILLVLQPNMQLVGDYPDLVLEDSMIQPDDATIVTVIDGKVTSVRHTPIHYVVHPNRQ